MICGCCGDKLKGTWYNRKADKHEVDQIQDEEEEKKKSKSQIEKEKDIDELQANEDKIKERELEEIKKALRKLTSQELDDEIIRLTEEIQKIKKELNPETDEEKQSKSASLEYLGIDNQTPRKKSSYHVLGYGMDTNRSEPGDQLLILMGSKIENTKENSKGDKLLQLLGSVN